MRTQGISRKLLAYILIIAFMVSSINSVVYAGVGGSGTGGGSKSVGSNGDYTYDWDHSGFRVTIVDTYLRKISRTIDFVERETYDFFSGDYSYYYTNHWGSPESHNKDINNYTYVLIDRELTKSKGINVRPPLPITIYNGAVKGFGEDFKKWFLSGDGISLSY